MIDPLYVVSGFGVGLLVGMTGVGGGSLMTPLLILLLRVAPSARRGGADVGRISIGIGLPAIGLL